MSGYYGGPPPSHSPQPGYGPPPSQYPPQGGYPPQQGGYPPQQGGYPPQQGGYPPQQGGYPPHGAPQGGNFPPPHQGYNQGPPPPGPYNQGPPPGGRGYGGPPPGQFPPGPQGGYPPQQGGYPPPRPQSFGGPPPPAQFPPQANYGAGPPSQPSPGYVPGQKAVGNADVDADALRKAMKGFGTDEATLIRILSKPDPLQMALLRDTFDRRHKRSLEKDIASETSGYFEEGLLALVRGPLHQDAATVQKAIKGLGTKESMLNDVLVGRTNADMRAIKAAYQSAYKHPMESDVKGDLSLKTEQLFSMLMAANRAEESAPAIPQQIEHDVAELHRATEARTGTDQLAVCNILTRASDGQLRAIAHAYSQRYKHTLEQCIEREFSGHMCEALLLLVRRATDRAMTDAVQLEDAMAGMGTKDSLLVQRVVRCHWDRQHLDQVKRAYQHKYKKSLTERVRGETSGDQQRLLVACLEG